MEIAMKSYTGRLIGDKQWMIGDCPDRIGALLYRILIPY